MKRVDLDAAEKELHTFERLSRQNAESMIHELRLRRKLPLSGDACELSCQSCPVEICVGCQHVTWRECDDDCPVAALKEME